MGRMRIALVLFLMLLLGLSGIIYAAVGIATSKHDFRESGGGHAVSGVNQICKNCHVPHTAPYNAYRRLLWLQTAYPGASITMWNNADLWYSQGFGGANKGIKGPPATTLPDYVDLTSDRAESSIHFCMSCHADGAFYAPGATTQQQTFASPLIAVDLTKTHPVNVVYESAFTGITTGAGLVKPTDPDVVLVRGVNGDTMVCRTCHDPHNRPGFSKFATLAIDPASPTPENYLCMHCHPTQ